VLNGLFQHIASHTKLCVNITNNYKNIFSPRDILEKILFPRFGGVPAGEHSEQ